MTPDDWRRAFDGADPAPRPGLAPSCAALARLLLPPLAIGLALLAAAAGVLWWLR